MAFEKLTGHGSPNWSTQPIRGKQVTKVPGPSPSLLLYQWQEVSTPRSGARAGASSHTPELQRTVRPKESGRPADGARAATAKSLILTLNPKGSLIMSAGALQA